MILSACPVSRELRDIGYDGLQQREHEWFAMCLPRGSASNFWTRNTHLINSDCFRTLNHNMKPEAALCKKMNRTHDKAYLEFHVCL